MIFTIIEVNKMDGCKECIVAIEGNHGRMSVDICAFIGKSVC
jgi:hypothetical protein